MSKVHSIDKLDTAYQNYYHKIIQVVDKERVFIDALHTIAYGTDASLYRLIPKIVIKALSEEELGAIMHLAHYMKLPLTVRTAGTSLSGQASSDSILVSLDWGFKKYTFSENVDKITLEPGLIAGHINRILKPYNKKLGPDPASIDSAMIGGIINNNSSGMCCGIVENSYQTIDTLRIMLYDGTILDTSDADNVASFRETHKGLLDELLQLAKETNDDPALKQKIIQKYKIKNTTGYSLNALTDFDDPIDILTHLIVGSEGTLAILLKVTLKTVEEHPLKASAMIYYSNIKTACQAVEIMKTNIRKYVFAAELFDRISINTIEHKPQAPAIMKELDEYSCCILVETRAFDEATLEQNIETINKAISAIDTLKPIEFSSDEKVYSVYWGLRKGLIPSLGEIRKKGTTVIIEDVAFPIEHLAEATLDCQALYKKYGYDDGFVMGHVLEGNLHLVFSQEFSDEEQIKKYDDFMQELCSITATKYDGSLKAEHGTGRNVAPFVELEWGAKAFAIMKKIKKAFDPENLLNPGVLINDDPDLHLKNLKAMPATHDLVDKCIECGFCESECPSRRFTLTPRQRIVANREMSRLEESGEDMERLRELRESYEYDGEQTCATCSMCEPACPVSINTGSLTKDIRAHNHSGFSKKVASAIAHNFLAVSKILSATLFIKEVVEMVLPKNTLHKASLWLNTKISTPIVHKYFPKRVYFKPTPSIQAKEKIVYMPSCLSRNMNAKDESKALFTVVSELLQQAGYEVIYPQDVNSLCCGMPFSSKGYKQSGKDLYEQTKQSLTYASNNGAYPVLIDTSPCVATMREQLQDEFCVYEPVEFINRFLLDKLPVTQLDKEVAIHSTCSLNKMGMSNDFVNLANKLSSQVTMPSEIKCCGFAGDKGFHTPALNQSALDTLSEQTSSCQSGYSNSVTCEIGLSEYANMGYSSIFYLLDESVNGTKKT